MIRDSVRSYRVLLMISFVCLTGCSQDYQEKVLARYAEEVKAQPSQGIEPIPSFLQREIFNYSAGDLRSPFDPPRAEVSHKSNLTPDLNRSKEDLENYPLDALRMVGTLSRSESMWALISAPDKMIYRVKKGSHLGQNFGEVEKINRSTINLVETVPDGLGGWKKRHVAIALSEP